MSDEPIRPRLPFNVEGALTLLWRIVARLARTRVAWIAGAVLLVGWCGPSSCTAYVPPNMVGVRQVYYGSQAGIKNDVRGPGLHFLAAGVERLHLFPHDLQVINFSDSSSEASKQSRSAPSIKIQTSDGYNVQLDVTVLYHLTDAYRVFVEAGPGRAFEDRLVIPRADRILRKTLGELNSEEFYQGRAASRRPRRRTRCSPATWRNTASSPTRCWCATTSTIRATSS